MNTHLKMLKVSNSCMLFFSRIIWINSYTSTKVRIMPAMGSTTVSDSVWIILKTPLFQPWGVWPTCAATSVTWLLTDSKIPVNCPVMASIKPCFIQSVIQPNNQSMDD